MRAIAFSAMLALAVSGWAQSLGEVARAERARAKLHAARVITNDSLNERAAEALSRKASDENPEPRSPKAEPLSPVEQELEHMRTILRGICSDPRTGEGRNLSETDKAVMAEGVKPLRARAEQFQRSREKLKEALAALDADFEAKVVKTVNSGKPLTDADLQRVKALRQEHDTRRAVLIRQGESELQAFSAWQTELEEVGDECSEASKTVPD